MSSVFPFRALRPRAEFVHKVASLPYDTFRLEEARQQVKDNPLSFLRIEKAKCDLPDQLQDEDEIVSARAKENLDTLREKGILFQDEAPSFYLYRQQTGDHVQTGMVACVSIKEYQTGRIKTHELTLAGKERERTAHINIIGAQTGPIFLAYHGRSEIDRLVAEETAKAPEYDFTADNNVRHTVWRINEPGIVESLKAAFSTVESLYIADGHHRAAAAANVAELRAQESAEKHEYHEYDVMLAVLFPHDQLRILGYNRSARDLNGLSEGGFIEQIAEKFTVAENFAKKLPQQPHDFGMYLHGKWLLLSAKPHILEVTKQVQALDVSLLQDNILGPILGISDPRNDKRIVFIGGAKGVTALENIVDRDGFAVSFSLYPPATEAIMAIADAGMVMPPKSTWFDPKLLSGLFVHVLD
jgi:uncharacterized protein (DUF1015 family)